MSELDTEANLKAADELIDNWPEVPHGERNDTAFKVASAVKDIGLSFTEVFDRMLKWNDEKCRPPLDDDELETTTKSAYRSGNPPGTSAKADPLEEFDTVDIPLEEGSGPAPKGDFDDDPADLWADESFPPDLPPGLLPPVLDKFVTDELERKGVERGAVALAALVASAAAIPAGFEVQVKQHDTGHKDRPIMWGALVGPPAARKTPVLNEVVRPLKAVEDGWFEDDKPKLRAYKAAHAKWKNTGQKNGELEPERPRERRKIINDTTVEALGPILRDNPNGVLSYTDELSGWIGSMDAYKPGKATSKDQPFWLQAKQGNAYVVDRVTRDPMRVARAAVHVLGGIQPDVIQKFVSDFSGNGMLQRFLLVIMGTSERTIDRAPDEAASSDWCRAIETLAHLHDSDIVPLFRFSPEADVHRREIEAFRDRLVNDPDIPPPLQGWIGKLESEWSRIALVFHLLQWADAPLGDVIPPAAVIGADSAERAARLLLEWQFRHQRHFYQSTTGYGAAVNAYV